MTEPTNTTPLIANFGFGTGEEGPQFKITDSSLHIPDVVDVTVRNAAQATDSPAGELDTDITFIGENADGVRIAGGHGSVKVDEAGTREAVYGVAAQLGRPEGQDQYFSIRASRLVQTPIGDEASRVAGMRFDATARPAFFANHNLLGNVNLRFDTTTSDGFIELVPQGGGEGGEVLPFLGSSIWHLQGKLRYERTTQWASIADPTGVEPPTIVGTPSNTLIVGGGFVLTGRPDLLLRGANWFELMVEHQRTTSSQPGQSTSTDFYGTTHTTENLTLTDNGTWRVSAEGAVPLFWIFPEKLDHFFDNKYFVPGLIYTNTSKSKQILGVDENGNTTGTTGAGSGSKSEHTWGVQAEFLF